MRNCARPWNATSPMGYQTASTSVRSRGRPSPNSRRRASKRSSPCWHCVPHVRRWRRLGQNRVDAAIGRACAGLILTSSLSGTALSCSPGRCRTRRGRRSGKFNPCVSVAMLPAQCLESSRRDHVPVDDSTVVRCRSARPGRSLGQRRRSAMSGASRRDLDVVTVLVTDYAWPDLTIETGIIGGLDGATVVSAKTGAEDELVALAPGADAILTCWQKVTPAVLEAAPRCRIVSRYGIGLDNKAVGVQNEIV